MACAHMFHYFEHEVFGVQGGGGRARLKFDKGAFHFQSQEHRNHLVKRLIQKKEFRTVNCEDSQQRRQHEIIFMTYTHF